MVHPMSSASSRFSDFSADPQLAQIKLPPHSLEAEQSLIGGILLDNQAWERVADLVIVLGVPPRALADDLPDLG